MVLANDVEDEGNERRWHREEEMAAAATVNDDDDLLPTRRQGARNMGIFLIDGDGEAILGRDCIEWREKKQERCKKNNSLNVSLFVGRWLRGLG